MKGLSPLGRQGRLWRRNVAVLPVLIVSLLAISTAACSSNAATTTTTTSTTTTSTAVSSTTTPTTTSAPSGTTVPAATSAAIDKAYMTLFDLASPAIAPKLAVVQDGSALRAAFTAALKSPLAAEAGGAKVLSVTLESTSGCSSNSLPPPCALVKYDVLSPAKQALLSNQNGSAIESGGQWLVSKSTICTLLSFTNGGTAPKGC
jgi:hypothetical protein